MQLSLEVVNLLVSSGAALITLVTGALVWWQTSQHFRHARSASYIERFNTEEYFNARMAVDRLSAEDPGFESIIRAEVGKEAEELERARLHVLMFANIFQEIGAAYRVKLVDQRYTWSVFGFLAQYYWRRLSPFVLRLRAIRSRPELYRDFEHLAMEMQRLDDKYAKFKDSSFNPQGGRDQAIYVFGYGSLMSIESVRKTIAVDPKVTRFEIARLYGYERGWFAEVPVMLGEAPASMAFLALRRRHEALCNGVLIPVTKSDLAKLDIRERGYKRVEVTPLIFPSTEGSVFTYVVDDDAATDPKQSVISADYANAVENAAKSYGEAFLEDYRKTTIPPPGTPTTASYRFADTDQNRAAGRS